MTPAVSILMAAYNAAACIDRAIDSVQAQDMAGWELIVVDDGSTDATTARVAARAAADPRIRLLRQPANRGPSAARNVGIGAARGAWITILDADDAFAPERLSRLLALSGGADMVADNLLLFDQAAGDTTGAAFARLPAVQPLTFAGMLRSEMRRGYSYGFLKPMVRAAFLRASGVRYSERLRYAEDFLLYLELLLSGARAVLCGAPLYVYTTQTGARSRRKSSFTHTDFTPYTRVEIARRVAARYRPVLGAEEADLLARYERHVTRYAHAHAMSEHKNARRYSEMMRLMTRQPKAAVRFLLAQKPLRQIFATGL